MHPTLWGTTRLSPPDNHLFAAYGIIQDGANKYVLVSNGINADLVPADKVPQDVLSSLHKLDLTTDEAREKVDKARAWFHFEKGFTLKPLEMSIVGVNGKTTTLEIDTKRFLDDWGYARGILETIYSPDFNVVFDERYNKFVRNPNRTEARHLKDLWLGMRMIYYHTDFNPNNTLAGSLIGDDMERGFNITDGYGFSSVWMASVGRLKLQRPGIDSKGYAHTNIDIHIQDHGFQQFAVYNPFTPDVKPRVVRAYFWGSPEHISAKVIVAVTDSDSGKNLYFELTHLAVDKSEPFWQKLLKHQYPIPLEEGQFIAYVTDPRYDSGSNAYHVQFGQLFAPRREHLEILNPYVAALQVYFMTHQADKYRPAWDEEPKGSGFWRGGVVAWLPGYLVAWCASIHRWHRWAPIFFWSAATCRRFGKRHRGAALQR